MSPMTDFRWAGNVKWKKTAIEMSSPWVYWRGNAIKETVNCTLALGQQLNPCSQFQNLKKYSSGQSQCRKLCWKLHQTEINLFYFIWSRCPWKEMLSFAYYTLKQESCDFWLATVLQNMDQVGNKVQVYCHEHFMNTFWPIRPQI